MQFLSLIRLVAQSFYTVLRCPDCVKPFPCSTGVNNVIKFRYIVSLYSWTPETHALNQASTPSRNSLLARVTTRAPQVVRRFYSTYGTFLTIAVDHQS